MKKIIVIGGSNVDVITKSDQHFRLYDSNPGTHYMSFGGVARNIAVNLNVLGYDVTLLSVMPEDVFGKQMIDEAIQMGIYVIGPSVEVSPMYVSIQNDDGDLIGAVASMEPMKYLDARVIETNQDLILSHDVIICDANVSVDVLQRISELDHRFKCIELVSSEKAKKVKPFMHHFHVIKGNENEIKVLFGSSNHTHIQKMLDNQRVMMTCGEKGVYEFGRQPSFFQGEVIQPVNTSGAGDAFLAGYIDGIFNHTNPLKRGYDIAKRALLNQGSTIKGDSI
jgi:pseudouridine kinase